MQFTWLWAFFRFKFPDETFQEQLININGMVYLADAMQMNDRFAQTIYQNNKTEYSELLDTKIWNSKRSRARKIGRRMLWYRNTFTIWNKSVPPLLIFYFVYFDNNELAFVGNTYKKQIIVNAIRATPSVLFNYSFGMTVAFKDRPLHTLPIIHSALISEHPF